MKPYTSTGFRPPVSIRRVLNDRQLPPFDEFIARAAALDVYAQYRKHIERVRCHQEYVEHVTDWVIRLGEPHAQAKFEAVH
jgi:hypothetical protein